MNHKNSQNNSAAVFGYLDYRKFLRDWFAAKKKERQPISYRLFSSRAGFTSPNFLKLVMDGERNLTEKSLAKFLVALKLNKKEEEFFRNLIFYNQAGDHEKKNYYYKRLMQSQNLTNVNLIRKEEYEFYSNWHHLVVRELVVHPRFDGTPEWISQKTNPKISPAQVEGSLVLLEKLGFIKKGEKNKWEQSTPIMSTGPEPKSHMIMEFHKQVLSLTHEMIDRIPPEKRDVSSVSLGISKDKIPLLKEKLREFRQELLKLVSDEKNPEEVVFLNMQLLPVTKCEEKFDATK